MAPDRLLAGMDEAGIALSIACCPDHYVAVHNTEGNDLLLSAVRAHPRRLIGMASANPWYGESAVAEVRRALGGGLAGLFLHSVYQGFRLSDHLADPLIRVAGEFSVPVYVHTGTAGIAEPFHAVELARRFPEVNFIMGHAGSSDYGEDAVRALDFAPNLWIETSRNGPANFCFFAARKCLSRVVFGSSAPEYIPAVELENLRDVLTDSRDQEAVLCRNIEAVFRRNLVP